MGLTPLDCSRCRQFSALTGIDEQKLTHRKREWPENVVWMKEAGNLYYSIRGYNKWMTQQAEQRYRRASGLDRGASRSTLDEMVSPIASRSHTQSLKASRQLLRLDDLIIKVNVCSQKQTLPARKANWLMMIASSSVMAPYSKKSPKSTWSTAKPTWTRKKIMSAQD